MTTWAKIAVIATLMLGSFAGGWWSKGGSVAKSVVGQQGDEIKQDQKTLDTRIADEHAAALKAQGLLATEQGKTADLNAKLLAERTTNASLQDAILHAHFQSKSTPATQGLCPGSPYIDPAYMQLYERAATGHAAFGTGDPAGYPSGVPAPILRGLPRPAGAPAAGLGDHD